MTWLKPSTENNTSLQTITVFNYTSVFNDFIPLQT